ncbi:hypothetical protein [Conexibacter woesei]|uniref:Ethyl tert-butyl ether degradation EthD n=1 Tax=Conexibacter woesei (strain DSM 14684 / CCUG 47730 / CIP 108061 / JCM 11494 / NBRC 100937 / ID131577) TaxID=469383 RepID=D3F581_CONWI|nr:hypothetical protein [Conexibacter woesei]ADB50548.1 hypothetical protein Cwoe_2123 [Conexibacter woesei DSM 14684]
MSRLLLVVRSQPTSPELDEAYTAWYAEHMAQVAAVEGVVSARRFESVDGPLRYMSMYELTGPEVFASPDYPAQGSFGPLDGSVEFTRNVYREIPWPPSGG